MTLALGIHFGTESARAVLVDCADGSEAGASVEAYEHPECGRPVPPSHR